MEYNSKIIIEKIQNLCNKFICNYFYESHYWNEKYKNKQWERTCLRCKDYEIFINNKWIKKNNS